MVQPLKLNGGSKPLADCSPDDLDRRAGGAEPAVAGRTPRVGRNVVDNFETAIERERKTRGYAIAFSFTKGAHEEAARARSEKGVEIELVEVATLCEGPPDRATPDLLRIFKKLPTASADLPLMPPPPAKSRPTPKAVDRK